jgi:hypothetical protein
VPEDRTIGDGVTRSVRAWGRFWKGGCNLRDVYLTRGAALNAIAGEEKYSCIRPVTVTWTEPKAKPKKGKK